MRAPAEAEEEVSDAQRCNHIIPVAVLQINFLSNKEDDVVVMAVLFGLSLYAKLRLHDLGGDKFCYQSLEAKLASKSRRRNPN